MSRKKLLTGSLAAVALAAGGAGAIAAASADERQERESRVLSDAAERLDVSPQELRGALRAAQDAELDRAVRAGDLTQEQADRIKARRAQEGTGLGGPRGPHGGPGHGRGGRGGRALGGPAGLEALAGALGLTRAQLRDRFEDGQTVGEVAEAEGKALADVRAAVRKAAVARLAEAVRDGALTDRQRDRMVEHLDEHLEDLASFPERRGGPFGGRGPGGPGGPPPGP
jgi:hypothetical protein